MTAEEATAAAKVEELIGTPYTTLDCQALMERILTRAGVKHTNWRGSNHMWRDAVTNRMTKADALAKWGDALPVGMWLFTVKQDGGEKARGYSDSMGNAAHVGWYLGGGKVIHSTTGGVQWDTLESARWTHVAECVLLTYPENVAVADHDALWASIRADVMAMVDKYDKEVSGDGT